MSSNKGSSQASRDSSNTYQSNDPGANQGRFDSNVEKARKNVEKNLGLKDGKATNLTGKDQDFYGSEASAFAKQEAVDRGVGKVGSYFIQQGGEFIRIDKKQYDKLKDQGATNLSFSLRGDKKTQEFMYGASSTAMGSGDRSGVLTSIPISQKMFERQRNIKLAIAGGLAMAGVPGIPSAMLYDSMRTDYEGYLDRFNKNMTSTSIAASSNRNESNVSSASGFVTSGTVADQTATANDEETKRRNVAAYSGLSGAEQDARRFLNATGRNITGSMN
tara:strand:+ start:36 stop:860 length:825 start_codon:yes stop_codon:yes gene_type:complete